MAKTIVFVRGVESAARRTVVKRLMELLNPDINTIRAIKLSLTDYVQDASDKGAMKAADKTMKNLVKKVLAVHNETHVVIDNENLLPPHWSTYKTLAEEIGVPVTLLGIEVVLPSLEGIDVKRSNLQEANRASFNCEMDKYIEARIDDLDAFDRQFIKTL